MSNMKEIARMAGVSLGTVSNVLSGSAAVRDPLRQRVMAAVDAVGYQPSQLARALRRDKSNMIAMIIPDITNPFFPAVVRGAEDVAFANGYRLLLCNTDNDPGKENVHLNELRTYLPAGLIVIPSSLSEFTAQAESYRRSGTAMVCVDRLPKHWDGDSVTADNEHAAYEAVNYILQQGHTRVAAIVGPRNFVNVQNRLRGIKRALRKWKLPIGSEYLQDSSFDRSGGYAKTMLLLRLIPRPTVIFAGNDLIALGAMRAFRELGMRCPEDISLMGFDDLDFAETTNPPLSTVSQPGYQMGTSAASLLIERVKGDKGPVRHIVLKTSLKIRESVAPPPEQQLRVPGNRKTARSTV